MRDEIAATGFRCLTKMRRIRVVLSFERVASQNGSHLCPQRPLRDIQPGSQIENLRVENRLYASGRFGMLDFPADAPGDYQPEHSLGNKVAKSFH